MNNPVTYDYIIAGGGCAGLSLAMNMMEEEKLRDKRILIIDRDPKRTNDRTWCFWETKPGLFEPVVYRKWSSVWVHNDASSLLLHLDPYEYKLIRGSDFYSYCQSRLAGFSNVDFILGEITDMGTEDQAGYVIVNEQRFQASFVFNSIIKNQPVLQKDELMLLQHFKGWVIRTPSEVFNPSEATLMDFRVDQSAGTTFVYVMPFSPQEALIEYTLFTENLLEKERYSDALRKYISEVLKIGEYVIKEEEWGVIPMTNHRFSATNGRVVNIGTAGGQTKASSGYTFRFIQKHSARIVANLVRLGNPFVAMPAGPRRFRFYDSTLLQVLHDGTIPGDRIFVRLFQKNKPQRVLRFLDNESSIADELAIVTSLPPVPFIKAAWKHT